MEQSTNVFSVNNIFSANDNIEKIIYDIKKGNLNDILSKLCFFNKKDLMLNYTYFK